MAIRQIFVSRDGDTNKIKLRDNEGHNPGSDNITTEVNPGDIIVWQFDYNSGLQSMDGVVKKSNSPVDVLISTPTKTPWDDNSYWAMVKSDGIPDGSEETYLIKYHIKGNPNQLMDDPKMKMVLGSSGGGG